MEYRQLGRSGIKVPELCFGCGTFGGANEFFDAWGATSDIAEARKIVDICMEAGINFFDTADIYSDGRSETVLGGAIQHLKREDVLLSTKATFRFETGPNDFSSSRYHLIPVAFERLAQASWHRLRRRLPLLRFRRPHTRRRDAVHAGHVRPRGQSSLHRLFQLLRLAPHEIALRQRTLWLDPLRWPPGLLLPRRPRLRVGTDATSRRPGHRRAHLVAARLGTADGQDPPLKRGIPKDSRLNSPARRRHGPAVPEEHLYKVVDALDIIAKETGKTVPQIALNWLRRRPTVSTLIIGARNEQQLRQNLGAVGWSLTPQQIATLDAGRQRRFLSPIPTGINTSFPYLHPKPM